MQRGAALASGVSQQAVEEEAGIRIAGVIPARIAPTGKIPFGRASFGNQVLNGHRLLGRPVRVKRGLEVPRLRLRHRITDAIGASRRSRWQLDARGSLWFRISVVGFIGHALWPNSLRRVQRVPSSTIGIPTVSSWKDPGRLATGRGKLAKWRSQRGLVEPL